MSRSSLLPSSIATKAENNFTSAPATPAAHRPHKAHSLRHRITHRLAPPLRWVHIYLSMFGLTAVLFFSATGLTLNHPDWFGEGQRRVSAQGQLNAKWLNASAQSDAGTGNGREVDKLEIVEHLRTTHGIRAALSEFRVEDQECSVGFKGPGYSADALINRSTGQYELTQTLSGFVAVINDLHKGRDTGRVWSVIIDAAAITMILISLSGVALLLYIKRKRMKGLMTAVIGTAIIAAILFTMVV